MLAIVHASRVAEGRGKETWCSKRRDRKGSRVERENKGEQGSRVQRRNIRERKGNGVKREYGRGRGQSTKNIRERLGRRVEIIRESKGSRL